MPAGNVVKSILVEMDARTAKLDAALERSGGKVRAFAKTAGEAGQIGTVVGAKYERAAFGIASAAESMARVGTVSGGATKTIVKNAAEIAFAFGAGGPLVAAIGIAGVAIVNVLARVRGELEETRKKFNDELKQMVNAGDASGLMAKAAALYKGTAGDINPKTGKADPFSLGIQSSDARIREFESRRNALTSAFVDAYIKKELESTKELREEYAKVRDAILAINNAPLEIHGLPAVKVNAKDATKALEELKRVGTEFEDLFGQGIGPTAQSDAFAKKIRDWAEAAKKAGMSADDIKAKVAQLQTVFQSMKNAERDEAFRALGDAVLKSTHDVVASLTAEMERAIAELEQKGKALSDPIDRAKFDAGMKQVREQWKSYIQSVKDAEAAQKELEAITEKFHAIPAAAMSMAELDQWGGALEKLITDLKAKLADPSLTEDGRRALKTQLDAAQKELNEWGDAVAGYYERVAQHMRDAADATQKLRDRIANVVEGLADIAQGAIAAAGAMGLMDAKTQAIANDIANLADAGAKLFATGGTDIGSWVKAIGSLVDLGSKLFSGETSAEKAERMRVLQENTAALRELSDNIGIGGRAQFTGNDFAQAQAMFRWLSPQLAGASNRAKIEGLSGENWDFLNKIAEQLGITLDGTAGSMRQLAQAVEAAAGKVNEFGGSFSSASREAEAFIKIFGITDPRSQLLIRANAGRNGQNRSPVFDELFSGLGDLTGAGQLDELRKRVQDLFKILQAGGEALTNEQLGGLTPEQLLELLEGLIDGITQIEDAAPKAASALDTLHKALSDLDVESEIMGYSPAEKLRRQIEAYKSVFPELASLFDGIDTTSAADLETFQQRLRDYFQALQSGDASIPDGTNLDELIQAILALMGAAGQAAGGIASAADKIAAAASKMATDFEIFGTGAVDQATQTAQTYGIDLGKYDLTSEAGRAAAVSYLQGLYKENRDNPDMVTAILATLRSIRNIPSSPAAGAADGAASAAASGSASKSGSVASAEKITVSQADKLVALTGTLVAFAAQELDVLRSVLAALVGRVGPLTPPALPSSYLVGAGGQVFEIRVTVSNNFYGNVEGGTEGADMLSAAMLRAINAGLGSAFLQSGYANGDASR